MCCISCWEASPCPQDPCSHHSLWFLTWDMCGNAQSPGLQLIKGYRSFEKVWLSLTQTKCGVHSPSTPLDKHHYPRSSWISCRLPAPASCPFAAGHCQDSAFSRKASEPHSHQQAENTGFNVNLELHKNPASSSQMGLARARTGS